MRAYMALGITLIRVVHYCYANFVVMAIEVELFTVVKCICECHQSRCRVVFDPEPAAMSTTFTANYL